jgi:hypothetical protein
VAEGFEPYSAILVKALNRLRTALSPHKTSREIPVTVPNCAHGCLTGASRRPIAHARLQVNPGASK